MRGSGPVCVSTCSVGGQVLSGSHQGPDHKPGQTQGKEERKGKPKNYLFLPTRNVFSYSYDNEYLHLLIISNIYRVLQKQHMVQVAGPAYCKVYPVCTLHPRAAKVPGLQCTVPGPSPSPPTLVYIILTPRKLSPVQ